MVNIANELMKHVGAMPPKLRSFIKTTIINDFRRSGVVIGVSGGIDSATTLTLSVQALGREKVYALILPEKESSPASRVHAIGLCQSLNVKYDEVPITPLLEDLKVYAKKDQLMKKIFPEYDATTHTTAIVLPANVLDHESMNIPYLNLVNSGEVIATHRLKANEYLELVGLQNTKQRSRMLVQYMYAEQMNYAVCGTTNKTELLTGYFVKYGDGGVDLEPLADCYKTQIFAIARKLGIDRDIIEKPPSADTWSHYISDQDFYLRMPYDVLDQILYAQEHNLPREEIESSTHLTSEQIARGEKHIERMKNAAKFIVMQPPVCYFKD